MKLSYTIPTVLAAFSLSSCSTFMAVEHLRGSAEQTKISHETDAVIAFGRTNADSQTMPKNELVMLGDRYIYVITDSRFNTQAPQSEGSEKLEPILNVKLSRAFVVHHPALKPMAGSTFPLEYNLDNHTFKGDFCLSYIENTELSAAERAGEQKNWMRCNSKQVSAGTVICA